MQLCWPVARFASHVGKTRRTRAACESTLTVEPDDMAWHAVRVRGVALFLERRVRAGVLACLPLSDQLSMARCACLRAGKGRRG